jgi:hypothetical protein
MTSSQFSRRPRVQPLPKICKKPPIPQPPDQPIETIRGALDWEVTSEFPPHRRLHMPLRLTSPSGQRTGPWLQTYYDGTDSLTVLIVVDAKASVATATLMWLSTAPFSVYVTFQWAQDPNQPIASGELHSHTEGYWPSNVHAIFLA